MTNEMDMDQLFAARDQARPLVMEWLRTRREVLREHEAFKAWLESATPAEVLDHDNSRPPAALQSKWAADDALVRFLGGSYAALALLDVLDHHFATDSSEIHGESPTVTFAPEFDQVLSTGKDAFERYCEEEQEVSGPATARRPSWLSGITEKSVTISGPASA